MLTRRLFLAMAAGAALSGPRTAFAAAVETIGGDAFGSYWRLSLPAGADPETAREAIEAVVAEIDALFSPYRPDSELSRVNRHRGESACALSAEMRLVLDAALAVSRASEGAFDPTVGPLVRRFGFGPVEGTADASHRDLRLVAGGLEKGVARLSVDLCGIAKGRALDRAGAALDALGARDWLLDLGGEVLARGRHPAGRHWQVAVEPVGRTAPVVLRLRDRAVATSGTAAQAYEFDGRRYGHVIDPARGAPAEGGFDTITVAAATGMEADAWATALLALEGARAVAMAGALGIDALFVPRVGAPVMTGGFDALVAG